MKNLSLPVWNIVAIVLLAVLTSNNAQAANKSSQVPLNTQASERQYASPQSTSQSNTQSHVTKRKAVVYSTVGIWLHSLETSVYQDLDRDGFYQNLSLSVDLDTNAAYRDVTIELWLKREGIAQHIFTSDEIHLTGNSSDDEQKIDIQFLDDYQPNYYQLEMAIIDSATGVEVFRVGQYDDSSLQDIAIESQHFDQDQLVSIYSTDIDLYNDTNHNGYYHQMSVSFDADIAYGSARLIAEFYIDDQLVHTSYPFTITGTRTLDRQTFDIEMVSGLASGYYDLDIHLVDASSHARRHHVSAIDWVVFKGLPLESYYWDNYSPDVIEVDVEQSGGALYGLFFALIVMGFVRKRFVA